MYRICLFVAFLALSTGAPFSDFNSQRSLFSTQDQKHVQQPMKFDNVQAQDEIELVDSLGGGYSFFKKQPIVTRPLIQQQIAIKEQPAPISSFDDTSNQWSGYTQASAFKHQPKLHVVSSHKDLIKDQGAYGSSLVQDQKPQPIIRNFENSYGQQKMEIAADDQSVNSYGEQDTRTLVKPQPLIRDDVSSYGRQGLRTLVKPQPLIRDDVSSFDQQGLRTLVQSQPLIRDDVSSYGEQDTRTLIKSQPLIRDDVSSYGQQGLRTLVKPQPLIRDDVSSYGQQDTRTLVKPQPLIRDDVSSFDQQGLRTLIQSQPLIRDDASSYGQQGLRTLVQQQPLIRDDVSSYGQQDTRTLIKSQPLIRDDVSSYGQQGLRTLIKPQPLIRDDVSSYGQQGLRTLVKPQPLIRDDVSSFDQQDLQQTWAPKSINSFAQNSQETLSLPSVHSFNTAQFSQPSWSFQQQSSPMISSRTAFQSLPIKQKSGSGSFGGW